jgi:DNA-binding SARP family transcriptional activator
MSSRGEPVLAPSSVERLLAFLAVSPTPPPRATVACTLWADSTEERAFARLRGALWRVEKIATRWVVREGNRLRLADDVHVDLHQALGHARRVTDSSVLAHDDEDFEDLLHDLLPHWDEEWLLFERERMRQLRVHALEALCQRLARERPARAIEAGIAAVAIEPLRESAHRALISAHLAEGNVSEARREFFGYRDLLEESLGVSPTPALRELALGTA